MPITADLIPQLGSHYPFLANQRYLYYKDGGLLANVPIDPLVRPERTVDMIVVLDTSAAVAEHPFQELANAVPSLKPALPLNTTNVAFPYVSPRTATYPTIIYIPVLKNENFSSTFTPESCGTYKFHYTKEEATDLCGLAHYLTVQAQPPIFNVLNSLENSKK